MATFDKLSAEQRAIIELVLQRGKSYAELSDLLAMPETRVRELARDALVSLSPVSAKRVEEDWRGQLGDYVLGQQTGPESTATRGHLRRSEGARIWAGSLLDSLDTLYEGDLPTIPDGDEGRTPRARAAAPRSAGGGGRPRCPRGRALPRGPERRAPASPARWRARGSGRARPGGARLAGGPAHEGRQARPRAATRPTRSPSRGPTRACPPASRSWPRATASAR